MRAVVACLEEKGRVWRDEVVAVHGGTTRVLGETPTPALPRLAGVVTGAFTDAHVHLQLVDPLLLADSVLGTVIDLGGDPAALGPGPAALSAVSNSGISGSTSAPDPEIGVFRTELQELRTRHRVAVRFAGAFLTPPGGYPSDRAWAPVGSVREIVDADAAASAVAEMKRAGADVVKVASNSSAGPVFSDELFSEIVRIAASHGLPVIAHAEGAGEAVRAVRLGARLLAHAPFSERLTEEELDGMREDVTWISTLAIHDGPEHETALDNVRRFHARGGNVLYGTDMGNGDTPVGLSAREVTALREAGIDGADLLRALAPSDPRLPGSRLLFHPGATPETADPLLARPLILADLET
ncbi:amidohydrolase family protein [Microbacterium tumbae]